jgi:hypothetical protein
VLDGLEVKVGFGGLWKESRAVWNQPDERAVKISTQVAVRTVRRPAVIDSPLASPGHAPLQAGADVHLR